MRPSVDETAVIGLKFSECLPMDYAVDMLQQRLTDPAGTRNTLDKPVRFIAEQ